MSWLAEQIYLDQVIMYKLLLDSCVYCKGITTLKTIGVILYCTIWYSRDGTPNIPLDMDK